MDESTLGSLKRRVPMLDGEFFSEWKNEMLEIKKDIRTGDLYIVDFIKKP